MPGFYDDFGDAGDYPGGVYPVDPVTRQPVIPPPGSVTGPGPGFGPQPDDLDPFREALARSRGIFGGAIEGVGGIANQFGSMAQNPFGTAENPTALGMQQAAARNQSRQALARRGLGGSTIAANEDARVNQGFVQQGLGQQQNWLGAQAGLLGQQAGLSEQAANLELAIPQIGVAKTAAANAGQGGGKK